MDLISIKNSNELILEIEDKSELHFMKMTYFNNIINNGQFGILEES